MMLPQARIIQVKKIRGVKRFSRAFVSGSKSAYEIKKIVSDMLYWVPSIASGMIIASYLLALTGHVQIFLHTGKAGISDVRSIEER
jgi:hypothetical protein